MLALLGLSTVLLLLAAILSRRVSPLVALISVPIATALAGGFGHEIGKWTTSGLQNIAPVVAMFVFAILFFGVMTDAGLFDPIVDSVRRVVGARPAWIVPGTAVLAALVHLDGSGAVTFLVVVPAMLPLYEALGMDRRLLACAAAMAAGVMNVVPWGGPTMRASAALKIPVTEIFNPMVPVMAVGLLYVLGASYALGRREEKRLARPGPAPDVTAVAMLSEEQRKTRRPSLIAFNAILTLAVLGTLVSELLPPAAAFMLGPRSRSSSTTPNVEMQKQRIDAHARAALMMASILFAAGAFTGIMQGAGMLPAMATAAAGAIPPAAAAHIPFASASCRCRSAWCSIPTRSTSACCRSSPTRRTCWACPGGGGAGGAARPDDHRLSGQPADAGDIPAGRPLGHRPGRAPEVQIPVLWAASVLMTIAAILFGVLPL